MTTLRLTRVEHSGNVTSDSLFQTNIVQSANTGSPWFSGKPGNPVGNPTELANEAIDYFSIQSIRFPGGSPNASFSDGMIIEGRLPENVANILSYARDNNISVNMVVPVETPDGLTRAEFLSQMAQFAEAVGKEYPGVVTSYELGNEYWGKREPFDASLERSYGVDAGETAAALSQGMAIAGYDADVFLQASGNLRGAHANDSDAANGAIQNGFASVPGAMDALDGIIRNHYWRDADLGGFENDKGLFAEDRGLEFNFTGSDNNWEDWLGRDLKTMVGEYNLNRNIGFGDDAIDLGIHGASYLLEHMSNMIDAGVDIAFAWPLSHNTQNAYLFRDEAIETTTVHGMQIVTNTTRAAMLDLMRQTIASHELVHSDWTFGDTSSDVEVTLFEDVDGGPEWGQGERIVFLSSRSPDPIIMTADLSAFVSSYLSVRAIAVHHEDTGGHLRDAIVREVTLSDPDGKGVFQIELQPYEVVQFIFVYDTQDGGEPGFLVDPEPSESVVEGITGTAGNDSFWGADVSEDFLGLGGHDTIFMRGGDDTVRSGDGDDFIRGGQGSDSLHGGLGDDTIYGDMGNDQIVGGAGWDVIYGGFGNDVIIGGSGNDTLYGEHGNDRLSGHAGNDLLSGGAGGDVLHGGNGDDTIDGGAHNDTLNGGAGSDIFTFESGHGHDTIRDFNILAGDRIDISMIDMQSILFDPHLSESGSGWARQSGTNVVITTGLDSSITIANVDLATLTLDHFIL